MACGQQSLTQMTPVALGHRGPVFIETVVDYARSVVAEIRALQDVSGERCSVALPDLKVETLSFDPELSEAVKTNFVVSTQDGRASSRLNACIVHPGIDGVSPPRPWDVRRQCHPERVAEVLREAGILASYFNDLDHWHIFDIATATAVQLMRSPGEYPPWETGAPLRPFLHWHYALQGRRLTHCGTLGINGKGVILAGAGGSGKSATVIAGLLQGLQSVGDDYVLLDASSEVIAYPLFATLKQDPAGFQRLGLSSRLGRDLTLNWQGKHQLTMSDIANDAVPSKLGIHALMLPKVKGSGRTEISPVGRAEAMIAVAASSIYQMPGERESGFRFFGEITRKLPCFRLMLGPDPVEVADAIATFIEKHT